MKILHTTLIDDCYAAFVNLEHRKDRLEHMTKELDRVGLRASRVRGMLPSEYVGEPSRVKKMRDRTPGAIGCYLSQMSIMETALALDKHAFVMEDDLLFCDDFHERMEVLFRFSQEHPWDVFWLGGTFHVNPPYWHKQPPLARDAETTDHPNVMRTYGSFSTHAYIVNRHSLQAVLAALRLWMGNSIGIDYSFIQMSPDLHTYAFVPGCVIQKDNLSDIGKGMTVFSNFKKLGAHWFQKRMTDFDPATYNWAEAKRK